MKRAFVAVVAVIALICFSVIAWNATKQGDTIPEQPSVGVTQTSQHPTGSNVDKLRAELGPWTLVDNTTTDSHAIVMLRANGTLEQGSRVIQRNASWRSTTIPTGFALGMVDGRARVKTNGAYYEFNADQAFALERQPESLYMVSADGQLYAHDATFYFTH